MVVYYVALPFTLDESGIAPGQPVECPTEAVGDVPEDFRHV
jgi:hypothetical protein